MTVGLILIDLIWFFDHLNFELWIRTCNGKKALHKGFFSENETQIPKLFRQGSVALPFEGPISVFHTFVRFLISALWTAMSTHTKSYLHGRMLHQNLQIFPKNHNYIISKEKSIRVTNQDKTVCYEKGKITDKICKKHYFQGKKIICFLLRNSWQWSLNSYDFLQKIHPCK